MKTIVEFIYRNWKGDESIRRVQPLELVFGLTPYHEKDGYGWALRALDLNKGSVERTFLIKNFLTGVHVIDRGDDCVIIDKMTELEEW